MANRVSHIGHTASELALFKGNDREITVNKTDNTIVVHDSLTPGGHEMGRKDLSNIDDATSLVDGKMTKEQVIELTNATANIAANLISLTDLINTNITNIGTNATNISNNLAAIGLNDTDISNLFIAVGNNDTDIGNNTAAIGINAAAIVAANIIIGNNTAAIGTNTTDIGTNTTNIGTNTSAISTINTNKPDKPGSPTVNRIVIMDASGNLVTGTHTIVDLRNASNLNAGTVPSARLPAADTVTVGALETATGPEAIAKSASNKILTPSNLASLNATTTFAGFVEKATQAEVDAGTDDTKYISPDDLQDRTPAAIGTYIAMNRFYSHPDGFHATSYLPTSTQADNVTESVGPTGSGADNIWTALDSIPSEAVGVKLRVQATVGNITSGNLMEMKVHIGKAGVTVLETVLDTVNRNSAASALNSIDVVFYDTLIDSNLVFDCKWEGIVTNTVEVVQLHLVGFILP